jgi:hypothetical protein
VENTGGRNGAYGPGFAQLDMRAGYRLRPSAGRTLDLFLEVFNMTNEANFLNPTGDMRSANFLIPTALLGGGSRASCSSGCGWGSEENDARAKAPALLNGHVARGL